jgi:hypothetical protein
VYSAGWTGQATPVRSAGRFGRVVGPGEEAGECCPCRTVASDGEVASVSEEAQLAVRDQLRGFREQRRTVEPVLTTGDDQSWRLDLPVARGEVELVLGVDGRCEVVPVTGRGDDPRREDPSGGGGEVLAASGRHQGAGGRRGRSPVVARAELGSYLPLQRAPERAEAAGGTDQGEAPDHGGMACR